MKYLSSREVSPNPAVSMNWVRRRSGRQMGARHPGAAQVVGHTFGEAPDERLAGGVSRLQPVRDDVCRDRADVQDRSATRLHHPPCVEQRQIGGGDHIQLDHPRHRVGIGVLDREAEDADACVVHQVLDVDTELVDAGHEIGARARLREIHRDRVDAHAVARPQFVGQCVERGDASLTRHHDHVDAVGREKPCQLTAYAGGCAGDEGGCHGGLLYRSLNRNSVHAASDWASVISPSRIIRSTSERG